jgi:hypothetical protein
MSRVLAVLGLVAVVVACSPETAPTTTTVVNPTSTAAASTTLPTTSPTTTVTAPTTSTTTRPAPPRIEVEDGAKREGPDLVSVRLGDQVVIEIEADLADEVHVHGYDLHFPTVPGEVTTVEFEANVAGIFEVELEASGLHLLDLEVTP